MDNWKFKSLGEVVRFSGGSQPPRNTFLFEPIDDYVRLIQIRDYKTDDYATYVPKKLAKKFCKTDDVMIGRYGPPIFQILRGLEGAYNVALIKAIPNEDELLKDYLFYFLKQTSLFVWIERLSQRTSGQTGVDLDFLKNYEIPLPPIDIQQKIIKILSTWDRAVENYEKLISAKQKRKRALMQRLLTGKQRFSQFADQVWEKFGAGKIFKNVSVKGFENEQLLSATQDKGVIPRSMLEARVTMPSGDRKSFKLVEKGDFVISLRSFQGGLEFSDYRGLVSPAYTVLKPIERIHNEFYKFYFKSYDFIEHLSIAVIGIRDGKQISYDDFCTVKIPYPSYEEQKRIADVLSACDREIGLLENERDALKRQKRGLMQKLLTGKVRVDIDAIEKNSSADSDV